MPDKTKKKKKKIYLRSRVPQVVVQARQARGRRRVGQMRGATRHLNAIHGSYKVETEEAPQVRELVAKQTTEPIFHGVPRLYLAGLSDLNFTINGQTWQEERIASRWSIRAIHSGELLGSPPTGREVTFTGVTLTRLEGELLQLGDTFKNEAGKPVREQWGFWVVEEWNYWDVPGLLEQIHEGRQAVGDRA